MNTSLQHLIREANSPEPTSRQTRAAARLMTLLEQDPRRLPELFQHLPAEDWPEPRLVLGVTGAPGAGKSSVTDALVRALRTERPDARVGVIAVDPSSPFTGGAVLGDRVRMMRHSTDPYVFIRSLATRGHLGGLSLGVRGVLRVMSLIGCEVVIIETVGVGQSEIEVARVADVVAIVLAPGHGDSVQLLKAGLLEVGDLFIVNKADREGANQLHAALLASLNLSTTESRRTHLDGPAIASHGSRADGRADVFLVSATEELGIDELIGRLRSLTDEMHEAWREARRSGIEDEMEDAVLEEVRRQIKSVRNEQDLKHLLDGQESVESLAPKLMQRATQADIVERRANSSTNG